MLGAVEALMRNIQIISFEVSNLSVTQPEARLSITSGGQLVQEPGSRRRGCLEQRDADLLDLFRKEGIDFELLFVLNDGRSESGMLWVTLYGREAIAQPLGETLQELDIYLQDPLHATRDLPYHNPHRFGTETYLRTTDIVRGANSDHAVKKKQIVTHTDLLSEFASEDCLRETEESTVVRTRLRRCVFFPLSLFSSPRSDKCEATKDAPSLLCLSESGGGCCHQTELTSGLLMSIHMETQCKKSSPGLLRLILTTASFVDNITHSIQNDPPPDFRGGILADQMGLGKSLSILALIAHDKAPALQYPDGTPDKQSALATLIVVPSSGRVHSSTSTTSRH